ncbi:MAG: MBOAT family O-acyltransferase [bacterium]|nr:MBOAT family O-acyltransferase [bacterium]
MELFSIVVFAGAAVPYVLLPMRLAATRPWILFVISIVAIFWLQPTLDIRWLDFSLPALTLAVVGLCWWLSRERGTPEAQLRGENSVSALVMIGIVIVLTLPRYISLPDALALTSRPPPIEGLLIGLLGVGVLAGMLNRVPARVALAVGLIGLVVGFVLLKAEPLTAQIAGVLRQQAGQDAALAKAADIGWLGFSYAAFRLIHTLRDRQMGLLPALTLREYVTYVIFFPAYTSGPIDRAENFTPQLRAVAGLNGLDVQRLSIGTTRILIGLFKKFAIADTLALISLNTVNVDQAGSSLALWGMLYAYAFRLFFDFSGYTDIAVGIGILFGITLPENFDRPYTKPNITSFWQSWHATLSAWARAYIYSPLSRRFLKQKKLSNDAIVLVCSVATMVVIGLWHGITLPFLMWGLWHGVGLAVHKYWSDRTRTWYRGLKDKPGQARLWRIAGVLLTFHFVLLGWVWFAMPDMDTAVRTFGRLFGIGAA